jgi:hypothetical protein
MASIIPRGHGGSRRGTSRLPHPGNPDRQLHPGRHRTVDTTDELTLGPAFASIQSLAATVVQGRIVNAANVR